MNQNETAESLANLKGVAPLFEASVRQLNGDQATGVADRRLLGSKLYGYLSSSLDTLKLLLRPMSLNGKRMKQEWAWRLKTIHRYHSPERFRNFALISLNRARGKWRLLKLHPVTVHTLFGVFLENTPEGARIVKLPLCSTDNSMKLLNTLKNADEFSKYAKTLTSLTLLPGLGQHCVKVTDVRRNGRYTSEFVPGPNLAEVRYRLFHGNPMPKGDRQKLANALQALIDHLKEYHRQKNEVIGDWSLNNLVFDPNRSLIINVDAEGFYTHRSEKNWWNWQKLETHLGALSELIRLLDSADKKDSKVADLFRIRDTVQGSGQSGSATLVEQGHSFELNTRRFQGLPGRPPGMVQTPLDFSCRCRSCLSRNFVLEHFSQIPFDFKNKVVLDLGCHMGDVLHALTSTIKRGYGFDVDPDSVNAAHLTGSLNKITNLEFFTFHPERQHLSLLKCFLLDERVDIGLLFASRNWLEQWPQIIAEAAKLAPAMLVEEEIPRHPSRQIILLQQYYKKVVPVAEALDDNGPFSLGVRRRLYLCTERKTPIPVYQPPDLPAP